MRRTLVILAMVPALSACLATAQDRHPNPARGLEAVNQPVVTRTDYALDVAAPGGSLPSSEEGRLDAWFSSLQLGYGDSIHVDGPYAQAARADVARVAGRYGLLLSDGVPVSQGAVPPGSVRVIVSRTRASVPGCPNWTVPAAPTNENASMSNFGCGVNSNLAAMVANPEDLIHGRDGGGVGDAQTATRAVEVYRKTAPTGSKGLQSINTKSGN